jgi:putative ABC transport system permease protein
MLILRLLFQTVFLALAQIWVNKVRAMLTTLGIIIAVAAVISIVGATTGLKQFVLDQFATLGANKVWIFPKRPDDQRERFSFRQIRINKKQVEGLLANCPSLARISPIMQLNATVQFGERSKDFVTVQGIWPEWHDIEQRFVTAGRTFSSIDDKERRQVCLINDKGLAELNMPGDPTGQYVLIGGRRFMVVGVVETRQPSPMFGGNEAQTEVFIPFETGVLMRPEPMMYVVGQSKGPEVFEDVKAEVKMYMRRMRELGPDDPDTFGVEAIDQIIQQFNKVAKVITAAAGGIVGISLLVGGIGIMNIMLVSVSERTREIGLRKAVGARPSVILLQFLVEAVVLCLMGGLLGLAIGYGLVFGLRMIPDSPLKSATVPIWAVFLAVGFSGATGVIFGMFPAIKAARLDPIEALRHE